MTTTPVRPGRSRPWWVGPILWSGLSQAMSSVTNFGLIAALAIVTDTAELGRVSAVLAVYLLGLAACRSLFTESMVASGRADDDVWRWVVRRVSTVAAAAMPVAGLVGLLVGLGWRTVVLLVVALPPLLLQDAWRYRGWAQGRPSRAVLLDTIWLAVSVFAAGVAVLLADRGSSTSLAGTVGSSAIVGAWCIGGTASAGLGWAMAGSPADRASVRPSGSAAVGGRSGPAPHRELARSQTVASLSFNLMPLALATVLSPTLAGVAKAVLLPFTPILSLVAGLRMVTLPTLARWAAGPSGPGAGRSPALVHAALGAAVAAPLAVVMAVAVTALPSTGDALELVEPHLPVGVALCLLFVAAQLLADGVALGRQRARTMRLRLLAVTVEWTGLVVGAGLGGAAGLVRGWTIGLAVAVVVWWAALIDPRPRGRRPSPSHRRWGTGRRRGGVGPAH